MSAYHQRITVALDYPVYFTEDVFRPEESGFARSDRAQGAGAPASLLLRRRAARGRALAAAAREHRDLRREPTPASLELAFAPWVGEGGEAVKNDAEAPARLHACFESAGLDRQSAVVVVGGGAFQDMVGYAAATAHRGLRVVRVPTTVLSQNDSGVGVKNGINAFGKKNFLGTFAAPFAVLDDARFLETLPQRDRIAGHGGGGQGRVHPRRRIFRLADRARAEACRASSARAQRK